MLNIPQYHSGSGDQTDFAWEQHKGVFFPIHFLKYFLFGKKKRKWCLKQQKTQSSIIPRWETIWEIPPPRFFFFKSYCSSMKATGTHCGTGYFILSNITHKDTTFIFASICSVNEEQPIVKWCYWDQRKQSLPPSWNHSGELFLIMVNDVIKLVNCLEVGSCRGITVCHYRTPNNMKKYGHIKIRY